MDQLLEGPIYMFINMTVYDDELKLLVSMCIVYYLLLVVIDLKRKWIGFVQNSINQFNYCAVFSLIHKQSESQS